MEGLRDFEGTLLLVSHDRWFVSQLATRVVEVKPDDIVDYLGTYEEYVHFCGDDHLDADRVILKAKREKNKGQADDSSTAGKARRKSRTAGDRAKRETGGGNNKADLGRLQKTLDGLMERIDAAEARVRAIDEMFCEPDYYETTAAEDVRALEDERSRSQDEVAGLTAQWEQTEEKMSSLR